MDTSKLPPEIDETGVSVYRHAVVRGWITPATAAAELGADPAGVAAACETLLELKLLSRNASGSLAAVHPDLALMVLNEPLVDEIRAREHAIKSNTLQLQRIADVLARATARAQDTDGILVLSDPTDVLREVEAATLRCTEELVTMQFGARDAQSRLVKALPRDLALLKRGVARRALHQHTSRANLGMRSYVSRVVGHGGEVRTTSESFESMLVFDRRTVLIPVAAPQDNPTGVAIVTHPVVVGFLYRMFERMWAGAMPFEDKAPQYDEVSVDIKVSLLRLMASGLKDEAIANRLGMATRTCRRHMSAIMEELGATSRFQAGMKIARLGILSSEPDTPVREAPGDSYPFW